MKFFCLIIFSLLASLANVAHAQMMLAQPAPAARSYAPYKTDHSEQYCIPETGLAVRNPTTARATFAPPPPSDADGSVYLRNFQEDLTVSDWEALVESYRVLESQNEFGRGVLSPEQFDKAIEDVIRKNSPAFSDFLDSDAKRKDEEARSDEDAVEKLQQEGENEFRSLLGNQGFLDGFSGERYFDDRSHFDLSADAMEAHALSELAKAYFDEGKFEQAVSAASLALELFAAGGVEPSPYRVKESDAAGHRESQFGANLAKTIQIYAQYELAVDRVDVEAAAQATFNFFLHWPFLEHLVWHFEDGGQLVLDGGRFDPVDWPEGKLTRSRVTQNLIQNLPTLTNPKSSTKPWTKFDGLGLVRAFWQDDETGSIFVSIEDSEGESFVLELAGGGSQPPQVPTDQLGLFGGGGDGRKTLGLQSPRSTIRIPVPGEARRSYLAHLRNEVQSASNDAPSVPYFAAVEEGSYMRFILSSRVLDAAGVAQVDEYNSFLVPKTELDSNGLTSPSSAGGEKLKKVMQATQGMALTLYASPYGRLPGEVQNAADDMLFDLAEAFPEQAVFRDVYTDETTPRAIELVAKSFGKPEDFVVLTAENDKLLQDWNVVGDLSDDIEALVDLGMRDPEPLRYIGSNASELAAEFGGSDTRVLVLTAHAEPLLEAMLYDLGEAGVFKNNIVILVSCRTPITRNLTEYLGGVGADAVFPFDRVLDLKDGTAHAVTRSILNAIEEGAYANEPLWRAIPKIVKRARTIPSISYLFYELLEKATSHG